MRQGSQTNHSAVNGPGFPVTTPLGSQDRHGQPAPDLSVKPERQASHEHDKRIRSLGEAFDRFEIGDGHVLSFHHHYRDGDRLLNHVVATARERGIKGLVICASSIFPVHAPLADAIEDGTIGAIVTDYMRGPVADAVAAGHLDRIALMQSHGGRARALASGQLTIDVAFVAAPMANVEGAATGRGGVLACGPLGYPAVDVRYARRTLVAAGEIVSGPLPFVDIPDQFVDAVLQFRHIGDLDGISSGSTVPLASPQAAGIGDNVTRAIEATGLLKDGLSLQSGAGGYSLGAVPVIGKRMAELSVRGSFLSGGLTGAHAKMLADGLFSRIYDVQCFDLEAVRSSIQNPDHTMMSAIEYASPLYPEARVNFLDVMLLGAVEVDLDFNVNVSTGADGRILGGPGGHPDAAQGAKLAIVTTTLTGGGFAKMVPKVRTVSTPGQDVDLVVTDHGIAVNERRQDLRGLLIGTGLPVVSIEALIAKSAELAERKPDVDKAHGPRIFIEHREGTILDWI